MPILSAESVRKLQSGLDEVRRLSADQRSHRRRSLAGGGGRDVLVGLRSYTQDGKWFNGRRVNQNLEWIDDADQIVYAWKFPDVDDDIATMIPRVPLFGLPPDETSVLPARVWSFKTLSGQIERRIYLDFPFVGTCAALDGLIGGQILTLLASQVAPMIAAMLEAGAVPLDPPARRRPVTAGLFVPADRERQGGCACRG